MSSEAETSREGTFGYAMGWKAWSRGLRPLRCNLDFARNDVY